LRRSLREKLGREPEPSAGIVDSQSAKTTGVGAEQRGFERLPRRWVAERTFAWICHNRRMAKDYERLCATGEALIHVAMTRLMVRRLAGA
jgi:transposase